MFKTNYMYCTKKHKHPYVPPLVVQTVGVLPERDFLGASLVEKAFVVSLGQEVEEYGFSTDEFNHQWE